MLLNQENLNLANTPYERVQMCKRLAKAISQLHNLQEPIYHRLINAKSVVLCDFSDKNKGIVPYLINFDFSKLKAADSKSTVLEQFKNQVDSLEQEDTEYVCEYDMSDISYEKMDVYALGILFIRILSGDLQSPLLNLADKLNLIEQNYNKKIADLLEWMISEVASDRPTAQKVYAVFNEVYESISLEKNDAIIVTPKEVRADDDVVNDETLPDFDYEVELKSLHLNESTKEEYIIPMDDCSEDEEFENAEEMVIKKEKLDFSYHEPNAPIKVIDNFDYLKNYDQKLYDIVKHVESTCITDHFNTAKQMRDILDYFVNGLIKQLNKESECLTYNKKEKEKKEGKESHKNASSLEGVDIFIKINFIDDNNLLRINKKLSKNESYKIRRLISNLHDVRNMANLGSHKEGITNPKWKKLGLTKTIEVDGVKTYIIDGEKLKKCFEKLNKVFRFYYGVKENDYDPDAMNLGGYDIYYHSKYHEDSQVVGYIQEYYGVKQGKTDEYAIIRRYKKKEMDLNFIQRNISTLELIDANTGYSIKGVAPVRGLNDISSTDDDEDYYIAYIFHKKPMVLNQSMLDKIKSSGEKVNICTMISSAISKLHNLKQPIYHRMINPKSIIICDYESSEGYLPYLIGFDFSKFENQQEYATVFDYYSKEVKRQNDDNEDVLAYICEDDVNSDTTFEKKDIYALGILFIRILTGNLNPEKNILDLLDEIEKEYSQNLATILERMIRYAGLERPSAKEVYDEFNKELEEYK